MPSTGHWQKVCQSPQSQWANWLDYTFEETCYKHINQIAKALKIENIVWYANSWREVSKSDGAQIDLLFDRQDGIITLCEIKYSINKVKIDKGLAKNMMNKIDIFIKATKIKKDIHLAIITSSSLQPSIWAEEMIQTQVSLDDLFTD